MNKRSLIVCADDYSLNDSVCDAILHLAQIGHLSATSCMTNAPNWKMRGKDLQPHANNIEIGLHFNLTEPFNNQHALPLTRLIQRCLCRQIDTDWVESQLNHQLDQFENTTNAPPDFIDGHQHIHVFPVIREIVFRVLSQRYPVDKPWIRQVNPTNQHAATYLKVKVLRMLAYRFTKQAIENKHPLSPQLIGIYCLTNPKSDYAALMDDWISSPVLNKALLMCHPATNGHEPSDPIAFNRINEFKYLSSKAFKDLCIKNNIIIYRKQ
jgi:chitin disaccharide deacetylase